MSDFNHYIIIDSTNLMSNIFITCLNLFMSDIFDYLIEIDQVLSVV